MGFNIEIIYQIVWFVEAQVFDVRGNSDKYIY